MLASSSSEIDFSLLFGIHFYSLHIIRCSVAVNVELPVTENFCTLYFVSLYIRGEVFGGGGGGFKTHRDIARTESSGKAGRIINRAEAGIGIRGVEGLVEEDYAVVSVEHQITGVDCAGLHVGCK